MVHVKTIAQSRDTRRDLVELDAFLASIWRGVSDLVAVEVEGTRHLTSLSYKHRVEML